MQISTSASVLVPGATPADVFAYATTPAAAAEFFRGFGPIPAIRSIEYLPGSTPNIGGRRTVTLADGSTLDEEVLAYSPPHGHAYRVSGFPPPLSRLTREARGAWTFEPATTGTRLSWHYTYELTSPLAWPAGVVVVKVLMRGAMQRALREIATRQAQ